MYAEITKKVIKKSYRLFAGYWKKPTFAPEFFAQVAELVDALDSKSSGSNIVRVRFPPWVQKHNKTR